MILAPSQVLLLTEMGIPVWEFRGTDETTVDTIQQPIVDSAALLEKVSRSDWLICVDKTLTEQTNRLLQGILLSIGLSYTDICLLSLTELNKLTDIEVETAQKVLLLFGDLAVKCAFGESTSVLAYRNETHSIQGNQLTTIVSFSLEDLIRVPENKSLVWQDCLLAKNCQQQL